jgi:hypothetical protein
VKYDGIVGFPRPRRAQIASFGDQEALKEAKSRSRTHRIGSRSGGSPGSDDKVRQFLRQHLGGWRVQLRASRKENLYATRECLFGMWQTRKCRERNVLMVRTTEEVVFRPPGGDIEGRAFRNRVSVQARAHRFIMNFVHAICAAVWRTDVDAWPAPSSPPGHGSANPKMRKELGKKRSLC